MIYKIRRGTEKDFINADTVKVFESEKQKTNTVFVIDKKEVKQLINNEVVTITYKDKEKLKYNFLVDNGQIVHYNYPEIRIYQDDFVYSFDLQEEMYIKEAIRGILGAVKDYKEVFQKEKVMT